MDLFLCELFDVPTSKDINNVSSLFSEKTLLYASIFNNADIHKNLTIALIYRTLFGIEISKILIFELRHTPFEANALIEAVVSSTFARFIINTMLKARLQLVQAQLPSYMARLQSDPCFVKDELWFKIAKRFPRHSIETIDKGITLFHAWSKLIQDPKSYFSCSSTDLHINPFYNTTVNLKHAETDVSKFQSISRLDAASYATSKDFSFLSKLCSSGIIIIGDGINVSSCELASSAIQACNKAIAPQASIFLARPKDSRLINLTTTCNVHTLDYDTVFSLAACIPTFLTSKCIFIDDHPPPKNLQVPDCALWITSNEVTHPPLSCWRKILTGLSPLAHKTKSIGAPFALSLRNNEFTEHILTQHCKCDCKAISLNTPYSRYLLFLDGLVSYMSVKSVGETSFRPSPNSKRCVICIDNRANIMNIIATHVTFANLEPETWGFVFIGSSSSVKYMEEHLSGNGVHFFKDERLEQSRFDIDTYNEILKDAMTWDRIKKAGFEKCLIIQDDGMLLRPGLERLFMNYTYIGAPWSPCDYNFTNIGPHLVGNGGLSLRCVDTMLQICATCNYASKRTLFNSNTMIIPEDVFFIHELSKIKANVADFDTAKHFAMEEVEAVYALGVHKFWAYMPVRVIISYMEDIKNPEEGQ